MLVVVVGRERSRELLVPGHVGRPDVRERRGGCDRHEPTPAGHAAERRADQRDVVARAAPVGRAARAIRVGDPALGDGRRQAQVERADRLARQPPVAQARRQLRGYAQVDVEETDRPVLAVRADVGVVAGEERRAVGAHDGDRVVGADPQQRAIERGRVAAPLERQAAETDLPRRDRLVDAVRRVRRQPAGRGQHVGRIAAAVDRLRRGHADAHVTHEGHVEPHGRGGRGQLPALDVPGRRLGLQGDRQSEQRPHGLSHALLLRAPAAGGDGRTA